ncbi:MAG: hypothetical protein M3164_02820 [Actinomycetota bacterium]|nr:hypothetical protein [Actinomycetota bacterium]
MATGDRPPNERQVRRYSRPARPRQVARATTGPEFAALVERLISTRETKEFFRTSEFSLWFVAVIGALVAAAISENFDAAGAWSAIALLTAGYILSRGIAKAGTARGWERLEDLVGEGVSSGQDTGTDALSVPTVESPLPPESDVPAGGPAAQPSSPAPEPVERFIEVVATPETKEFFRTSEFLLWLLGVIGVLFASAITLGFGAASAWTMITVLSSAYILSRGIAKANVARGTEEPAGYTEDMGPGAPGPYPELSTPETKEFFRTSEFWVMLLTAAGILIASGIDFGFEAPEAWRLLTALGMVYMISRGISKIGTARSPTYPGP